MSSIPGQTSLEVLNKDFELDMSNHTHDCNTEDHQLQRSIFKVERTQRYYSWMSGPKIDRLGSMRN